MFKKIRSHSRIPFFKYCSPRSLLLEPFYFLFTLVKSWFSFSRRSNSLLCLVSCRFGSLVSRRSLCLLSTCIWILRFSNLSIFLSKSLSLLLARLSLNLVLYSPLVVLFLFLIAFSLRVSILQFYQSLFYSCASLYLNVVPCVFFKWSFSWEVFFQMLRF